jgi:hypothetical protein
MKRICILLLALMPMRVMAQEITIDKERNDVVYTNTVTSAATYDDLLEYILAYGVLDNVVTHRNMIAGDLPLAAIDYEAAGYSRMKLPLYLVNGEFTCRIIIHSYEEHYDVEACKMRFISTDGALSTSRLYDFDHTSSFDTTVGLIIHHLNKVAVFK